MPRLATALILLAVGLLGCDGASSDAGASAGAAPSALLLAAAPDGARTVSAAKLEATEGATIAVRGRIGGRKEAIAPAGGSFVMVDASLPWCAEGEDGCRTPWDYCCEPREGLLAATATVQIVDAEGRPLAADLRAAGLAELDEIVVVGTVGPRPSPEVLVIRATGIHRVAG